MGVKAFNNANFRVFNDEIVLISVFTTEILAKSSVCQRAELLTTVTSNVYNCFIGGVSRSLRKPKSAVKKNREPMKTISWNKPFGRWAVGSLGRWAVGPLGRWAVVLCASGLLMGTRAACAGEWVVSYEAEGTSSANGSVFEFKPELGNHGFTPKSESIKWEDGHQLDKDYVGVAFNSQFWNGGSFNSTRDAAGAFSGGTVRVVWKWQPKEGETEAGPVPAAVTFQVEGYARAKASDWLSSALWDDQLDGNVNHAGETGSVTLNMGFVPPLITGLNPDPEISGTFWTREATRLFQYASNGQTSVQGPLISLSAQANIGANRKFGNAEMPFINWKQGRVEAGTGIEAKEDNRSVKLTRNGATNEWQTIENGVPVTHGDTTYSYYYYKVGLYNAIPGNHHGEKHYNEPSFAANFSGAWKNGVENPDVYWNWVVDENAFLIPFGGRQKKSLDGQIKTFGGLGYEELTKDWRGVPITSNQSITFKYFARDNEDQAEAEARYVLHLHEPVDNITHSKSMVEVFCGFLGVNGEPAVVDHAASLANPTINTTVGYSSGWSVGGSIGNIAGFKLPLQLDFAHDSSMAVGTEKSITLDNNDQPVEDGEQRQVLITYKYDRHHSFFDAWDKNGKIKRMACGPGSTVPNVEVQHEGFADEYVTSSLSFSDPYDPEEVGTAPYSTTPPPLPPFQSTFQS